AAGCCGSPEIRIPTSIGGGCARTREIGLGRLAPRVFDRNAEREHVILSQEQAGYKEAARLFADHSCPTIPYASATVIRSAARCSRSRNLALPAIASAFG